jgi:hypothetical protein
MNATDDAHDDDRVEEELDVVMREVRADDPEAYPDFADDGRLYYAVARLMEGQAVCVCPRKDDWADLSDSETPFSLGATQTYRDSLEEVIDEHIAELVTLRDKLRQTRS